MTHRPTKRKGCLGGDMKPKRRKGQGFYRLLEGENQTLAARETKKIPHQIIAS